MSEMLPAPSMVFSDDYFRRSAFGIKVLHAIALLYGFSDPSEAYLAHIILIDLERLNSRVMQQVWLARFLGLDLSSPRSVVGRFKNARNLSSISMQSSGESSKPSTPPKSHQAARSQANTKAEPAFPQLRAPTGHVPLHRSAAHRSSGLTVSYSIELLQRDYETCARQHLLTESQKAEYLLNVLEGPARTFMLNNYTPGMTYEQVSTIVKREYNGDSRGLQI
eukprot:IDg12667t1